MTAMFPVRDYAIVQWGREEKKVLLTREEAM